jgi:hypothetical protein
MKSLSPAVQPWKSCWHGIADVDLRKCAGARRTIMKIEQLERGEAYYRLTYADPVLTIPSVEPMMYVGTNIFPDDDSGSVIYYFQDTVSYLARGAATDLASSARHPEINIRVFPFSAREIGVAVVSLDDVIAALLDARTRGAGRW